MASYTSKDAIGFALLLGAIIHALPATATDPDFNSPQVTPKDSINATVSGRLKTYWDAAAKPKLFYACAKAGGSEIELDPAGCPNVTRELLDFINTQGGAPVSSVEVVATGELVFERRAQSARYRETSHNDADAIVPVLKVHSLKITTLPMIKAIGGIRRDRETVTSTTVGVTRR